MALEITGKVHQILETQSGEGRNGTWKKGGFVLETEEQYPKNIHCTAWGDLISQVNALKVGDKIKANIDLQSREYNGRWYTDVKVWRLEKVTTEPIQTPPPDGGNSTSETTPPPPPPSEDPTSTKGDASAEEEDDLPF